MFQFENIWTFLLVTLLCTLFFIRVFNKLFQGKCNNKVTLAGKNAIVTGGNSGLGYESVLHLATKGCRVIIADVADSQKSISQISKITKNNAITYKYLNLASIASVRQFAEEINRCEEQLDILINNAGVATMNTNELTEDGIQKTMQINYFGHYLLTHLLASLLKKTPDSRIVFVSSLMAFFNNLSTFNLKSSIGLCSYQNSKLALIIAADYFSEKFKNYGVNANSVHPGLVRTPLYFKFFDEKRFIFLKWLFYIIVIWPYAKTAEQGSQTTLFAAYDPKANKYSGRYLSDCIPFLKPLKAYNKSFCNKIIKATDDVVGLTSEEKNI